MQMNWPKTDEQTNGLSESLSETTDCNFLFTHNVKPFHNGIFRVMKWWCPNDSSVVGELMMTMVIITRMRLCFNGFLSFILSIDHVCKNYWMGGKGGERFPRFLYASNPNGCNWVNVNCAKEADTFTISVLWIGIFFISVPIKADDTYGFVSKHWRRL